MPVEKVIGIALYRWASGSSYHVVGDVFKIGLSTVFEACREVASSIVVNLLPSVIKCVQQLQLTVDISGSFLSTKLRQSSLYICALQRAILIDSIRLSLLPHSFRSLVMLKAGIPSPKVSRHVALTRLVGLSMGPTSCSSNHRKQKRSVRPIHHG